MYLLDQINICTNEQFNVIWDIVGTIINVIWIGIPIILIVLGTIDLGKAVISSKDDEVKKAKKSFMRRFMYAVLVFAVVWLVQFVFDMAAGLLGNDFNYNETSWKACWEKIRN